MNNDLEKQFNRLKLKLENLEGLLVEADYLQTNPDQEDIEDTFTAMHSSEVELDFAARSLRQAYKK